MKIIFLDIDGVLNCDMTYPNNREYPYNHFDPNLVSNLNMITKKTGANIVITSSWRINRTFEELKDILKNAGVTGSIIGVTERLYFSNWGHSVPRGCEILHLYTGNPKDMHEVEEVIKRNTSRNMGFVWADSAPAFLKHPKTQEMGIIPIEPPTPSIMDFVEYGKTMEYEALKALRIPIDPKLHCGPDTGILGPFSDYKTNVSIQDSDWLVSSLLMQTGFKGFDQRRKLAKRRGKAFRNPSYARKYSFYKRYKLI